MIKNSHSRPNFYTRISHIPYSMSAPAYIYLVSHRYFIIITGPTQSLGKQHIKWVLKQ